MDSLVLLSPRLPSDRLRALSIPGRTVLFNRLIPGLPGVVVDCVDGMRRLVAHLAALGHRHVGYAGGPRASFGDAERRRGLAESGRTGGCGWWISERSRRTSPPARRSPTGHCARASRRSSPSTT
ncbi:hypothetical protein ACFQ9X_23615 [Catenulispora yoronensis]